MNSRLVKTVVISAIAAAAAAVFIFLGISTFLGSRIDNFGKLSDVVEMTEEPELSAWDENADAVITVSFSDVIHRIDDRIYGADLADGMELLAPKDALTIQKLSVLRLGGEDFSRFDMSEFSIVDENGVKTVIPAFGETLAWFNEAQTDVVLQINMLSSLSEDTLCPSSPELAVAYLKRLKEQYGVRIKYVSLDNEPMNWNDAHKAFIKEACTCERYCEAFAEYAKAIKSYDNDIVIIGLDGTQESDWNSEFLTFCAEYEKDNGVRILDMLSLHPSFENGSQAQQYIGEVKKQIDEYYPETAIAFGEYRVENANGDQTLQALELASVLGKMAEEEVSLACYSTLLDSEKNAMIDDGGVVYDGVCYGEKRPSFYTFHMMSNFLTGSLASCSCSDEALETYAVTDGNAKRIIAVNTADKDKKCSFSSDIDRIDSFSFDVPARTVTVLELNGETILTYICRTDNLKK